jgi:hypothetical protein
MASKPGITYDKSELSAIAKSFKAMDEEALTQTKETSNKLADFVNTKIGEAAAQAQAIPKVATRIASGGKVSKTSKFGEISYGFARQKFSGGATTQDLWGGAEFGSNKYKQFPVWSGREGKGSRGWFIYPTLRSVQPEVIKRWETAFADVVKKYD